jgi:hypothetical protein
LPVDIVSTQNLFDLVQSLRSLHVSEGFVQGTLFLLGGVLLREDADTPRQRIHEALQWVVPHDINAVGDGIVRRMQFESIKEVIEEYLYIIDVDTPTWKIQVESITASLIEPVDHNLLPKFDNSTRTMSEVSNTYFAMIETIGDRLKSSKYDYGEAYLAGICFFSYLAQFDQTSTGYILDELKYSPPSIKFFFSLPIVPDTQPSEWLPTQIALWGFVAGIDQRFIKIFWPYQSWLLYDDGNPLPGVEDLAPRLFYDHCYEISGRFLTARREQIREVSKLDIGPNEVPAWSGNATERLDCFRIIEDNWGYDPSAATTTEIERMQINACIIFILFCSICRAVSLN